MSADEMFTTMEEDFLALLDGPKMPLSVFEKQAVNIIGDDWREVGREIAQEASDEALKQFEEYLK